jgi:hypothetical protein
VLYLGLLDDHGNCGLAVPYVTGPISISKSSKALSNGVVEAIRHDLNSVISALDISTRGSADAECHAERLAHSIPFAICWSRKRTEALDVGTNEPERLGDTVRSSNFERDTPHKSPHWQWVRVNRYRTEIANMCSIL